MSGSQLNSTSSIEIANLNERRLGYTPTRIYSDDSFGQFLSAFTSTEQRINEKYVTIDLSFDYTSSVKTDNATFCIVYRGGTFIISDITVGTNRETGFNPSTVQFLLPFDYFDTNTLYQFKAELFGFNSNKAQYNLVSNPVYISGSQGIGDVAYSTVLNLSGSVSGSVYDLDSRIFTDATGKLNKPPQTGSLTQGLYTGETFMGFWSGSN